MATLGMRHAVLWVSDPAASARFYADALGLVTKSESDRAVFMASPDSATDHDLGLFKAESPDEGKTESPGASGGEGERRVGLYHIAWEMGTLGELAAAKTRLETLGALVGENNHGVSRSLYCHDPDGIEFEVMWELPLDLYDAEDPSNVPLDLEADIKRWGPDRAGRGAAS